jgi:DNA polymerase III psi subunit
MDQEVFATTYQEEIFQFKPKPVVVINNAWEHMGEKERELLSKIISALKISIDSITVVSQPTLMITSFKGKTGKLIYFGDLPTGVARYEVLESEGLSFICSESLSELIDNEAARKQLWLGLRRLFSV